MHLGMKMQLGLPDQKKRPTGQLPSHAALRTNACARGIHRSKVNYPEHSQKALTVIQKATNGSFRCSPSRTSGIAKTKFKLDSKRMVSKAIAKGDSISVATTHPHVLGTPLSIIMHYAPKAGAL